MYWLQAYVSFIPRKNSNVIRYNKKVFRSHAASADHSSPHPEIRLTTIHSANSFSTYCNATPPSLYHFDTLLTEEIGGS
ncbi:MAG: hypothetical protein PVF82_07990 [Gammaproteobacteria bacterium]